MSAYPLLEHEGRCASISTQREPTGRWIAWVSFERDPDFARLKAHAGNPTVFTMTTPVKKKRLRPLMTLRAN